MAKGTVYPKDFYVIADNRNSIRFYEEDPFLLENAEDKDVDFGQRLFAEYGIGDARNPLVIRVLGTVLHRCEEFRALTLLRLRNQNVPIHVEDAEGNIVNIESEDKGVDFPIVGQLVTRDGELLTKRRYSNDGKCEDELRSHRLVIVRDKQETETQQKGEKNISDTEASVPKNTAQKSGAKKR